MKKFKHILEWMICCILLFGLLYRINDVFRYKIQQNDSFKLLYELDDDTVDVLMLGCSSVYTSINPHILYDDYGIASFVLGQGGLLINYDYYYLVEALKTQSPKILILDTLGLRVNRNVPEYTNMNYTAGLKISKNKMDLFYNEIPKEQWVDLLLQFPIYHSRYSELSSVDFLPWRGDKMHCYEKGESINWTTEKAEFEYSLDVNSIVEKTEIPAKAKEYFTMVIDLARENDIEVVLYAAPYAISEEEQKKQVWVKEYAQENGLRYIDGNSLAEEIGIKIPEDLLQDGMHLNYEGNIKVSRFIGAYLNDNFDLPDRRNDERYLSWEIGANYYNETYANFQLKLITSFQEYVENIIKNDNYTIIMTKVGECDQSFDNYELTASLENNQIAVWQSGKLAYILPDSDTWYMELSKRDTVTLIKNQESREWYHCYINEVEYGQINNAVNILVYDNLLEQPIEKSYWTNFESDKNQ